MKSNYIGVHQWGESAWVARIKVKGKALYLGSYYTQKDAAHAVKKAIFKYRGKIVSTWDLKKDKKTPYVQSHERWNRTLKIRKDAEEAIQLTIKET